MKHGQIVEYRDAPREQFSKVTVLEQRAKGSRMYRLTHHTPGFECAGSCARWAANEVWAVLFDMDGATHGRRFLKKEDAQALLDAWTSESALA